MITSKEDVLRTVDELVKLGSTAERLRLVFYNCGQRYIEWQNAQAAYLSARETFEADLGKVRLDIESQRARRVDVDE